MISRGPLSVASGLGSVFGSAFGSDERLAAVVVDPRLGVPRAGGFGLGAGSVDVGSSVLAVSTGVSVGFGDGVVVRRVVDVAGRRPRAVRGVDLSGTTSGGFSVTSGDGDSTGVGAGVGSGRAGTVAISVSGGGASSIRAPTEDVRRPFLLLGGAPVAEVPASAISEPSIGRNDPEKDN